jgi:hypothetical protein
MKDLTQKKLLNEEHFEFVQYQLELMILNGDRSNFVTEVRAKIAQRQFDKQDKNRLEQYFEGIDFRSEAEKVQLLRNLHGGLEKILCFLKNATIDRGLDITIEEFCTRIHGRLEKDYRDRTVLSQFKLSNIIELYQLIEEKYFPYITRNLKQEFFVDKHQDEIEK